MVTYKPSIVCHWHQYWLIFVRMRYNTVARVRIHAMKFKIFFDWPCWSSIYMCGQVFVCDSSKTLTEIKNTMLLRDTSPIESLQFFLWVLCCLQISHKGPLEMTAFNILQFHVRWESLWPGIHARDTYEFNVYFSMLMVTIPMEVALFLKVVSTMWGLRNGHILILHTTPILWASIPTDNCDCISKGLIMLGHAILGWL